MEKQAVCPSALTNIDFSSQEGQTYVGREDASTEQDIGETLSITLSDYKKKHFE